MALSNPTFVDLELNRYAHFPETVAVIVVSHNYGRFLADCLASVLQQTWAADEILVVDDCSTDDTQQVTEKFAPRGVRYLRIDECNVHAARGAGYHATSSEAVCFLDADDVLPDDYLERGREVFTRPEIGIAYSDIERFEGEHGRTALPAEFDRASFERDNYLHAGSIVRREALRLSGVFEHHVDPLRTQADWLLWRSVLQDGWLARKQKAYYRYRQHGDNWMRAMHRAGWNYFDYADLGSTVVTLFIPLSGRGRMWPRLSDFLDRQAWPHNQVRLILLDTSQDAAFFHQVRRWLARSDYADVRHQSFSAGRPALAEENRRDSEVKELVRTAMARIYNRLARDVSTEFVWVLEDDILPPDDACERLLRGFDRCTVSVSAAYLSRYDGKPCVWDEELRHILPQETRLQEVHGNGFGCVVLRGGVLRQTVFRGEGDFDRNFYRDLHAAGLIAKVDWSVQCEHRSTTGADSEQVL